MKSLIAEIRRRRVIPVMIAYIVVGWAMIEAAATLLPMFNAPGWATQTFTIIVFLGLPIAIVVAWFFQVSDKGVQVDPGPETSAIRTGEIRFAKSFDGTRIAYAFSGEGPPLVKSAHFLTNIELDWNNPIWHHWLSTLSEDHRLLRYDIRGCGASTRDVQDLSLDAMVADLECVVDDAGLDKFVLVGPSQGGPVSIAYAAKHSDRVNALILYGSYAVGWHHRPDPEAVESHRAMIELVRHGWGQDNPAFRQMFGSLFIPDANETQRNAFNSIMKDSASPELASRLLNELGEIDVTGLLGDLRMPVLVTHVRGDARIPMDLGRQLAAGIPGAEFKALNGNNHIMMPEDPAFTEWKIAFGEFLSRHAT
jgi:pimeloyl-ACP methyl ester carboxylesterase